MTVIRLVALEAPIARNGGRVEVVVANPRTCTDFAWLQGQAVELAGAIYRVARIERHAHMPPWHEGERIAVQLVPPVRSDNPAG